MMRAIVLGLLIVLAGVGIASGACVNIESSGVDLATLAADSTNCLVVGDKQFFNFIFVPESSGISSSNIFVTTFGGGSTEGVQFTGPFGLNGGSTGGSFDFALGYNVVSTAGLTISSISDLIAAGCSNVSGGACTNAADVNVAEIANDPVSGQTANSFVDLQAHDLNDPPGEGSDSLTFGTPVSGATITKDVAVSAGIGDIVGFSIIKQDFEQVPEPRAYALVLGFGLALLLWRRRAAAQA